MTPGDMSRRILDGIRVLDFTQVIAGPYCTRLLADLGADVVKIDRIPAGSAPVRSNGGATNNAGKRSIAMDLKSPRGAALAGRLAAASDVVVENFAPGVLARLGLDYATLAAANERLIYASISGFGQSGSHATRRAYGATAHAEAGLLWILQRAHGEAEPLAPGLQIADVATGMNAFAAILAVLYDREHTGRGQQIDITLMESQLAFLGEAAAQGAAGADDDHWEPFRHPIHRSKDGRHFTINLGSPRNWSRLMEGLSGPDLAVAPSGTEANELIGRLVAQRTAQEVVDGLERSGAPYGLVKTLQEALGHPFFEERETVVWESDPLEKQVPLLRPPMRFSRSPAMPAGPAPLAGGQTREVLEALLGLEPAEVDALLRDRVVGESGVA